jgi:hypothetical protein
MKLFKDKDLTVEVSVLDLGILEAGQTQQYTFWVYNDTKAYLKELEFTIEHKEIKLIEAPKELESHGIGELRFSWSPAVTLREGLKAPLKIRAKEQWG